MHALAGPALALAQHEDDGERRGAGVDVHHRTAGEVERAEFRQPTAGEDPMGHRGVDEDEPETDEQCVGLELEAIGGGTGDERRRDHGEGHLIRAEEHERDGQAHGGRTGIGGDVTHPGEIEIADDTAVTEVAEGQRERDGDPDDGHEPHGEEVLHEHAEHVLGSNHAAVEEGQTGRHEQDESGRDQHPGGIATIDHFEFLGLQESRMSGQRLAIS